MAHFLGPPSYWTGLIVRIPPESAVVGSITGAGRPPEFQQNRNIAFFRVWRLHCNAIRKPDSAIGQSDNAGISVCRLEANQALFPTTEIEPKSVNAAREELSDSTMINLKSPQMNLSF
jgi:hypothetical protein